MKLAVLAAALAALACLSAQPALAAEADTPADLLRALYAAYPVAAGRTPPVQDRPKAWFGEPLLGLVLRDQAAAKASGEPGGLDFDPICACQDDTGLRGVAIAAQDEDAVRAKAVVGFRIGAQAISVRYRLARTEAGWRIVDVGTDDVPSLVKHLRRFSQ
ncbi:hypothetical protein [Methylobacterium thuringiense]|uniref:DUF3828 domain-containing protein n=1 Tax=Methylobacterium thuringiense TaxID=1003091 RepID=A0ABQ4TKC0_9HYPH|nr:hypothetical protein [Methylobacterium thuringiense]GJE55436.1 hypothetical protein EKPJFOCH_1927 [Methylobacterium thuringiense]